MLISLFNYIYVFQIQCALLYTTVYGQRRIRVTTLSLPCTSMLSNLFRAADLDTQFSCYMKQGIQICYFSFVLSTFVASVMHVFPICVGCFPELNPVLKIVNWFMRITIFNTIFRQLHLTDWNADLDPLCALCFIHLLHTADLSFFRVCLLTIMSNKTIMSNFV